MILKQGDKVVFERLEPIKFDEMEEDAEIIVTHNSFPDYGYFQWWAQVMVMGVTASGQEFFGTETRAALLLEDGQIMLIEPQSIRRSNE